MATLKDIKKALKKNNTKSIKMSISFLRNTISQLEDFVVWPALIYSLKNDLAKLEHHLKKIEYFNHLSK